jgi:hypothetical protein
MGVEVRWVLLWEPGFGPRGASPGAVDAQDAERVRCPSGTAIYMVNEGVERLSRDPI